MAKNDTNATRARELDRPEAVGMSCPAPGSLLCPSTKSHQVQIWRLTVKSRGAGTGSSLPQVSSDWFIFSVF